MNKGKWETWVTAKLLSRFSEREVRNIETVALQPDWEDVKIWFRTKLGGFCFNSLTGKRIGSFSLGEQPTLFPMENGIHLTFLAKKNRSSEIPQVRGWARTPASWEFTTVAINEFSTVSMSEHCFWVSSSWPHPCLQCHDVRLLLNTWIHNVRGEETSMHGKQMISVHWLCADNTQFLSCCPQPRLTIGFRQIYTSEASISFPQFSGTVKALHSSLFIFLGKQYKWKRFCPWTRLLEKTEIQPKSKCQNWDENMVENPIKTSAGHRQFTKRLQSNFSTVITHEIIRTFLTKNKAQEVGVCFGDRFCSLSVERELDFSAEKLGARNLWLRVVWVITVTIIETQLQFLSKNWEKCQCPQKPRLQEASADPGLWSGRIKSGFHPGWPCPIHPRNKGAYQRRSRAASRDHLPHALHLIEQVVQGGGGVSVQGNGQWRQQRLKETFTVTFMPLENVEINSDR